MFLKDINVTVITTVFLQAAIDNGDYEEAGFDSITVIEPEESTDSEESEGEGIPSGTIIGIVIATVLLVLLTITGILCM